MARVSVPSVEVTLSRLLAVIALVGRYPTNKLIARRPIQKRIASLLRRLSGRRLSGISSAFAELCPSLGYVIYALLPRSPLSRLPYITIWMAGPFDLHAFSTPPAFVLSQDQTLKKMNGTKEKILSRFWDFMPESECTNESYSFFNVQENCTSVWVYSVYIFIIYLLYIVSIPATITKFTL